MTQKDQLITIAALIVYVVYAIFNNGYYYYDEHFQLIEFAELKAGNNLPSDLTWEYIFKIRSALQPMLVYWFFSLCRAVGINDHYVLITLLRVFTSIVAVSIITFFLNRTFFLIRDGFKTWYRLLSYFLWFLPFINVRFSSESYAGLTVLLSIATFYSCAKFKPYLMGLLFGLSFLFRFQSVFLIVGFFGWLIFIDKASLKFLLKLVVSGLAMVLVGIAIDTWFYGTPTLSFYNYYLANVVYNKATGWGVSPWYFYITDTLRTMNAGMAVIIWTSIIYQFITNRHGLICWIVLPFLVAHCITPHKELRFLFPMANLIPLIVILTAQSVMTYHMPVALRYGLRCVIALILIINIFSIIAVGFSPADSEGRMTLTQYIRDRYNNKQIQLLVFGWDNPYRPIPEKQNFYLNKNVHWKQFNFERFADTARDTVHLIVIRDKNWAYCQPLFQLYALTELKSGLPIWLKIINNFLGFKNGSLTLYEIKAQKKT
jgi:phosphatidylinositol glycan class B